MIRMRSNPRVIPRIETEIVVLAPERTADDGVVRDDLHGTCFLPEDVDGYTAEVLLCGAGEVEVESLGADSIYTKVLAWDSAVYGCEERVREDD